VEVKGGYGVGVRVGVAVEELGRGEVGVGPVRLDVRVMRHGRVKCH